jgi:hypothetical protein
MIDSSRRRQSPHHSDVGGRIMGRKAWAFVRPDELLFLLVIPESRSDIRDPASLFRLQVEGNGFPLSRE